MRITVLAVVVGLAGLAARPEPAAQPAGTLYRVAYLCPGFASTPDIPALGLPAFRQRRRDPGYRTAAEVALTVPQSILRRADEVIR